jgi:hypothetical protein
MDFEVPVVVYVAQLPKLVHEVAHAGARRADHLRERLLADLRDYRLMRPVLAPCRSHDLTQLVLTRFDPPSLIRRFAHGPGY